MENKVFNEQLKEVFFKDYDKKKDKNGKKLNHIKRQFQAYVQNYSEKVWMEFLEENGLTKDEKEQELEAFFKEQEKKDYVQKPFFHFAQEQRDLYPELTFSMQDLAKEWKEAGYVREYYKEIYREEVRHKKKKEQEQFSFAVGDLFS